jgi:hypothetical protein
LWVSLPALAGTLESQLDRERVEPGETFSLTLRIRGGSQGAQPDLRPLGRDFEVLDVATSYRTQLVNGRQDESVDWRITLLPRETGELEVPAIPVGAQASTPHRIEVDERAPSSAQQHAEHPSGVSEHPVFIEAKVDDNNPYVQGGVTLTVRLHADERVIEGSLSEPSAGDAILERVGEDQTYRTRIGDREYSVIERTWSLFPQRSGPLTIAPVAFQGTVRQPTGRTARRPFGRRGQDPFASLFGGAGFGGSLFDEFFGPAGQAVRAQSTALTLEVQPRPAAASGPSWLPAREVTLIEQWEPESPTFKVGEPVHRVVAIRAAGVSASQLPELELTGADGLKQYSEPRVAETVTVEDELIAIKAQEATIIPTREGEWVLPAVELAWWDTVEDAPRTARLPARTIQVAGGTALASATPPPSEAEPPSQSPPSVGVEGSPAPGPIASPLALLAIAMGLLSAAAALGWGVRRATTGGPVAASDTSDRRSDDGSVRSFERQLKQACKSGDARSALLALHKIGLQRWPEAPPAGATGWSQRLGCDELTQALEALERVQYSPQREGWRGDGLWQAYAKARRVNGVSDTGKRRALPSLYPLPSPRTSGGQPA